MQNDFLPIAQNDFRILLQIKDILSYVDPQTLVIFDLDYTLFRSSQNIGMPEWIHYFINNELSQGASRIEAFKKWYPAWLKAQEIIDIEVMDSEIYNILNYLEINSVGLLGLTARGSVSAEITEKQLSKLSLRLNRNALSNLPVKFEFEVPVLLQNGVLYTHEFNDKGTVFIEWFHEVQKFLSKTTIFNKIIFIDDSDKNIYSMEEAAKNLNLSYIGFHYIAADIFKAKFNPKIAEMEAALLMKCHSSFEAKNAIHALHIEERLISV